MGNNQTQEDNNSRTLNVDKSQVCRSYTAQFVGSVVAGKEFYHMQDTVCENNGKDMSTLAIIKVIEGDRK